MRCVYRTRSHSVCFYCYGRMALRYISDLLILHSPSRDLTGSTGCNLHFVSRTRTVWGDRTFSKAGPQLWNSYPLRIHNFFGSFKKMLTTYVSHVLNMETLNLWGHFTEQSIHIVFRLARLWWKVRNMWCFCWRRAWRAFKDNKFFHTTTFTVQTYRTEGQSYLVNVNRSRCRCYRANMGTSSNWFIHAICSVTTVTATHCRLKKASIMIIIRSLPRYPFLFCLANARGLLWRMGLPRGYRVLGVGALFLSFFFFFFLSRSIRRQALKLLGLASC